MKYTIKFKVEVEMDALSAYHWYEGKSKGLGEEFLRIFYANALDLRNNPLFYRKIYKNFRRRLIRRFPYAIYFLINNSDVIIYALFHSARDPQKMNEILLNRK